MVSRVRASAVKTALLLGAAFLAAGCDTGGLLVVEQKPGQQPPPVQGPSVNEMVSGGNFASNSRYRIFYSLGQPSPNQNVATSPANQLNGGIVGAAHGD